MPRVLVTDPLSNEALELLRRETELEVSTSLSKEELLARVAGADALLVRSQTRVTREVIEAGTRLQVVGRAGVGVDNIDVAAATQRGVLVVNSPSGNTISAAEHTMALLLAAARRLPQAHQSMVEGKWDRKSFTGSELYNKTLGVVGFGRIGREVASRAASFKMKVLAYDPFVSEDFVRERGCERADLDDLLSRSDFVTLHVPLTEQTENLMDRRRLGLLPKGAFLVNCARGKILDEGALAEAVRSGRLGGAALDVYREEPPKNSPVVGVDRLITTPHLAASTHEAQVRVALDVAEQVLEVLQGLPPRSAVNIPYLPPKVLNFLRPYLTLAEKMGFFLHHLTDGPIRRVRLTYCGELAASDTSFVSKAALKGVLSQESPETVNFVNAVLVAEERGIEISETRSTRGGPYANLIQMEVETDRGTRRCAGTVFLDQPRIVEIDGLELTVVPEGVKLLTWQTDQPGVVGRVGTILGECGVNIAEMQVGRRGAGTRAVMAMSVDNHPGPGVVERIRTLDGIEDARLVCL
ncbi:MAG: phosphoglycerate dehydrogenase [Armatimonadetes bacterium]|nr:phosphoglycerate dehydrogenase [Armatimonadota bacterium]